METPRCRIGNYSGIRGLYDATTYMAIDLDQNELIEDVLAFRVRYNPGSFGCKCLNGRSSRTDRRDAR